MHICDLICVMNYESRNKIESWHLSDTFTPHRYRQMIRSIKICPDQILDVGIGSGIGGSILRLRFPKAKIIGLEAVKERTLGHIQDYDEIKYGLATQQIFRKEEFELIVAGELLEHLEPEDVDKFLREMFQILKHNGLFIFTTPNPQDIKSWVRNRSVLGGSHRSQHFIRETIIRLRMESFKVLKVEGTGKTSRYIGRKFPKFLYGSYMVFACKR